MATVTSRRFTIVWLDSEVNSGEENLIAQQRFFNIFDNFEIFEDKNVCQQFIESNTDKPILLIVSGRLSRQIIPDINRFEHMSGIYIYCMDKSRHEEWTRGFDKIKGIIITLDDLITQIKSDITASTKKKDPSSIISPASSIPKPVIKTNNAISSTTHASGATATVPKKSCTLDGYEKEDMLSLERATEPLSELIPNIKQMIWTVTQNCQNPEEDLSIDESASIGLYTMEWYPPEDSFACILNAALRSEDKQQIIPWFRYLKIVFSALSKLKTVTQIVYRGSNTDITSNYPKGKVFVTWEFLICTNSMKTLEDEECFGKTGQRTLFTIECRSGKDISRHAFDQSKEQVLLLPGRQFKVISSLSPGDDLNIVQLEEMKSPYSFE